LNDIGELAGGDPFKPLRTLMKAKQAYKAGIAIEMSAEDILAVIAEAFGTGHEKLQDFQDSLRALNPDAAKSVFG
jgi:hypothetical protein